MTSDKKGFTLIEMLLYLVILSMMLTVILSFSVMLFQTRIKSETVSAVEAQGEQTLSLMLASIRNGTQINSPTIGSSGVSASLNVYDGAKSPTLFDLSSGAIRIKEGASAYTNITNNKVTASGLNFQNLSQTGAPGVVRISFTLAGSSTSGRNEYQYTKTFTGNASLRW